MKKKCPICKGKGIIEEPKQDRVITNRIIANLLYQEGYGIREIQRFLEYKSPRSIQAFLNK